MKHALLLIPLALAAPIPAVAASDHAPRQDVREQTPKTNYWLSQDMSRLAFWQSRESEPEMQTGRSVSTH